MWERTIPVDRPYPKCDIRPIALVGARFGERLHLCISELQIDGCEEGFELLRAGLGSPGMFLAVEAPGLQE